MLRRFLEASLIDALGDTPCVVVHGPRQSGKTTLVRDLLPRAGWKGRYLSLDDASVLQAASADPTGFVESLRGGVVIDEIQRVPELLLAIKASIDRDRRPGRFVLTGSADVLALPRVSEALVGRMEALALWPLAQAEIARTTPWLTDHLFEKRTIVAPPCHLDEVAGRLARGGYPEPLARPTTARRRAWFDAYVTTVVQRDVRDLANVHGLAELPRLLSLVAARTGGLLNRADLGRDAALPHSTLERYLALLEATFLVRMLPAWHASRGQRLVKAPKLLLVDTGLATHLLGLDAAGVLASPSLVGPLVETFALVEMLKQAGVSETRPRALHFRSHAGAEVDLVLEDARGRIVGVEVKSSRSVKADDFRGLRALAELSGDRFLRGVILHPGTEVLAFNERLASVPMSCLWSPPHRSRRRAS